MRSTFPYLIATMEKPDLVKDTFMNLLAKNGVKIGRSKTVAQQTLYCQKEVDALSEQDFFSGAYVAAESNMRSGSYTPPEDEPFLITHIRMLDGTVPTNDVDQTPWAYGANAAENKNSTFTINNGGVTALRNIPGTSFITGLTDDSLGALALPEPILWKGQTNLELQYRMKSAAAAAAGVRFELIGLALIS